MILNMKTSNKIIVTIVGLGLALLAQLALLDKIGLQHTQQGLSRALVTYGISRGLNGVISVVQGTEIAVEPVGVGMTFTPGQILDPINDLIERFSTIVLISGTAFGIQRVLLEITAAPTFSIAVGILIICALALLWRKDRYPNSRKRDGQAPEKMISPWIKNTLYKLALIGLIVRFCVPIMAIGSEQFYQVFLAPQFEASSQQLLATTQQLNAIEATSQPQAATSDGSLLDSMKALYQSASNSLDVKQHLADFKQAAEGISENTIHLIVVFLFQTFLLPLGSVWLILKLIKWVAGYSGTS